MSGLLDTSFVIEVERQNVRADTALLEFESIAVSVMTFAEVLVGRPIQIRERATALGDLFQQDVTVLPATAVTARYYTGVLQQL